jgi:hypothetical protein
MKQFFSRMIVASSLGGLLVLPTLGILSRHAIAQLSSSGDLSYTFAGQQIPLTLRSDVVGVSFKQGSTRGGSPYHSILQFFAICRKILSWYTIARIGNVSQCSITVYQNLC